VCNTTAGKRGISPEKDHFSNRLWSISPEKNHFSNRLWGISPENNHFSNRLWSISPENNHFSNRLWGISPEKNHFSNRRKSISAGQNDPSQHLKSASARPGGCSVVLRPIFPRWGDSPFFWLSFFGGNRPQPRATEGWATAKLRFRQGGERGGWVGELKQSFRDVMLREEGFCLSCQP
jgi:hypothetical protein